MKPYIIILIPYLITILVLSVIMSGIASEAKQRAQEAQTWAKSINLENIRVVNIKGGEQKIQIKKGEPRLKIHRFQPSGLKINSDTLTIYGNEIWGLIDEISLPNVEIVNAKTSGTVIFNQDTIR